MTCTEQLIARRRAVGHPRSVVRSTSAPSTAAVASTSAYRSIELVQGRMPDADGDPVEPIGVLLTEGGVGRIKDAEIPREGIAVRRLPSVTRRADGTYVRWLTRRISVGRGEGASQLRFDAAPPRRPKPNTAPP